VFLMTQPGLHAACPARGVRSPGRDAARAFTGTVAIDGITA